MLGRTQFLCLGLALLAGGCKSTVETQVMAPPAGVTSTDAGLRVPECPTEADPAKQAKAKGACAWKVDDPPGDETDVAIDTTTGTWMNLDVSPDGETIVFDLLGDLYTLPIAGGQAVSLTSGIAWDMQPRFAPDGKWLAFTSDRGGGDNIWVLPIEAGRPTGEAKPITNEDFRLLSAPAWSPDGEYIVGRKHFTSRRSIGAGEMWLYHRSGGKGVQLTKKRTDQKDSGEPVYSPDGRYLYISEDMTAGPVFDYNKDPNGEIYVIRRLDLEEGRLETFISGPGGAVRPTPSPDGKLLAYVHRVRLKSVLMVRDLDSGAEWAVHDGLDRDMQETWAIHGVYPQMDFTPDSQTLVFWAGGKLHRVPARGGEVAEIPFRVTDKRAVGKAVRSPVEVAPAKFDVKVIRWPQVAPDGKRVVFAALGKLYVRDMASGAVRRLTTQTDHHEFYPSLSRDGKHVVYVAWDDAELGSVRVVPISGGAGRVVSPRPGHYVEPVFAPDGKHVVYRRARGGGLFSPRWSRETGVFAMPVELAGQPKRARKGEPATEIRVSRTGFAPQFGAASDRVFMIEEGEEDVRILVSMELDGNQRREHVQSKRAEEFQVSPDGRWLAFVEGFRVHVVPFASTGTKVDLGPGGEDIPVGRVSENAGWFVHWSGDARSLHWVLGPELHTRELSDVFSFLEGAPQPIAAPKDKPPVATKDGEPPEEVKPEPVIAKTNIGFSVERPVGQGTLALVGGKIVTMKGDEIIEAGTVVIEGNRITAIGPTASVKVPAGANVIDVAGHTLIPGLVDVHAHGPQGGRGILPEQNWLHYAELAFGVTTVHDPSNDSLEIFSAAELVNAGLTVGPRIFSTGTILYGAEGSFRSEVESLDDARMHLGRMKAIGAISVKSYNQPRRDQRQKVLQAARELGLMVVPEGGSLFQHNMSMVVDGHTGIEHAIPVAAIYDDVRQLWGHTDVGYTPTLVVAYGGVWGENYWYQHTEVWDHARLLSFVPREYVDERARRRMHVGEGDWNHFEAAAIAHELTEAGVEVNLGAHGQREGLGAHWELWMFVQGGMTPHQALRAGTSNGAKYVGLDGDIGSLEVGKLADIAVIAGDPLADIRDSEKVVYTVIDGRIFDAATMAEIGDRGREPAKLWWQIDAERRPEGTLAVPVTGAGDAHAELGSEAYCGH